MKYGTRLHQKKLQGCNGLFKLSSKKLKLKRQVNKCRYRSGQKLTRFKCRSNSKQGNKSGDYGNSKLLSHKNRKLKYR